MTRETMQHRISRGLNNAQQNELIRQGVITRFRELIAQYTEDRILSYIERVTQIDKNTVERWFNQQGYSINTAFAKKIVLSIRSFTPDKLSGIPTRLQPPVALKKSLTSE